MHVLTDQGVMGPLVVKHCKQTFTQFISLQDKEYSLLPLWADGEFLVTCLLLPNINPTTTPIAPPGESGQVLRQTQYPQFPVFPQYVVPTPITHVYGIPYYICSFPQVLLQAL